MKTLVTGGAGFIGSHVAEALLGRGHEVVVIDDLSSGRAENLPRGARFIEADIRDRAVIDRVFSEHAFDVVCHQAAQTSVAVSTREPVRDAEINILGGLNLLEATRASSVGRFVFASTGGAIYGDIPDGERADEAWPPRPISPYACSKLAFERYLEAYRHEHRTSATVLRYANVYGPRQDPHGEAGVVAIFCQRLVAGEPIQVNARAERGDDGCVRDYVYVGDVVRANVLAVEGRLEGGVLNVGSGVPTTTRALARAIADALGAQAVVRDGPRRAGDLASSVLRPNDELLGHGPLTSIEEGIRQTAQWFRERS